MEETEKMSALKKGYAEIILNASKEAAARIIVSERRAQGFQRELSVTKDEALRLCLRMKQMMDSKMNEVALKSSSQQRRIDVLEAQLQEAEDIVSNLRAELAEAQFELSRLTKNQQKPFDEKNYPERTAFEEKISTALGSSVVDPQALSSSLDTKDSFFELRSCQANSIISNGHAEDSFARKPDSSSVPVRRAEPKNRGAQRIQACEMNGLTAHLTHSRQPADDVEGEKIIQQENGGEGTVDMLEEKVSAGREILTEASACWHGLHFKSFHKKRRRDPRHKRHKVLEPVDAAVDPKEPLDVSHSMAICSSTSNHSCSVPNQEDSSNTEKVLDQRIALNTKQTGESSGASTESDMKLIDALILIKQENGSKKDLGTVGCEARAEVPARSSATLEGKEDRLSEGVRTVAPHKDRIVKYTFQRKRKRESMNNKEGDRSHQVVEAVDAKAGMKHDGDGIGYRSESTMASDSPRDSRRLVQVAHQEMVGVDTRQGKRPCASNASSTIFEN